MDDINFLLTVTLIMLFGAIPVYLAWRYWIVGDLFRSDEVKGWKGLRRKTPGEMRLEQAGKWLAGGSAELAVKLYREHLETSPDDPVARLGLADSLMDLSVRGTKKEPEKRAEALVHYRWVLERYARTGEKEKAAALLRRLEGPFARQELGS
jgi:hypothetical protein